MPDSPSPMTFSSNPGAAGSIGVKSILIKEAKKSVLLLLALLASCAVAFSVWAHHLPALTNGELEVLRTFPPRSLPQLVAQRDVLLRYAHSHPGVVAVGLCGCYILMQSLAVPGTLMLSVLGGALYGARTGFAVVALVSTAGSCSCYCLSWALGRTLVHAAWPDRLHKYAAEVAARRSDLLSYVIFLRVTPLLPNTFINLASPIVGVPLLPFALGTLLGCAPNNLVAVNAGAKLSELNSLSDLYDRRMVGLGLLVGLAALAPVVLKRRYATAVSKERPAQAVGSGKKAH